MHPKQVEDVAPQPGWYVLKCPPQKEAALEMRLGRSGLTALVPREVYWAKPARRTKANPNRRWVPKERALFGSLVFVEARSATDWVTINRTPLVLGALAMAGRYYRLKDSDVDMLYSVDGMQREAPREPKQLKAGDKARVSTGAFAGHSCDIQSIAGKRALILLMLFGSMKVVEIPVTSLEAT